MKKFIAMLLVLTMALSLAACSGSDKTPETTPETTPVETTPEETTVPEPTTATAVELLQNIFNAYAEDARPPICGGSGDTASMEGPGAIAVTDTDALQYSLLVPEAQLSSITDAASMGHMMNANSLTVGAFKIDGDVDAFVNAYKDAVVNNQWFCGFPEKVVFYSVDGYILMAFGKAGMEGSMGDFLNPLADAIATAYPTATLIAEADLM